MNPYNMTVLQYPAINEFRFMIKKVRVFKKNHVNQIELHSHRELELYINLTVDISFLVDNSLYPVTSGDIIVSRPNEYHHCVYNSDVEHNHFWILVDIENNSFLYDFFFNEIRDHLVSPHQEAKEKVIEICDRLVKDDLSSIDRYYYFFNLMMIIKQNANKVPENLDTRLPNDLVQAIQFINEHLSEKISVSDIADALYLSDSTIARRFKTYLEMNPLEFIHRKRMFVAAERLRKGDSVLDAGTTVGYSDNSYFISVFKRFYGVTPYRYKKERLNPDMQGTHGSDSRI